MTVPRHAIFLSTLFILLVTGPVLGQFRETYEPPGYILQWGSSGGAAGQFDSPTSVAVDAFGNVYVADIFNARIQKFDAAGNYVTEWGSAGGGGGQFSLPSGVATDATGNVYVADTGNDRIQKFDSDGNFLKEWDSGSSVAGHLQSPSDVAVDRAGNVYVADTENDKTGTALRVGSISSLWRTH